MAPTLIHTRKKHACTYRCTLTHMHRNTSTETHMCAHVHTRKHTTRAVMLAHMQNACVCICRHTDIHVCTETEMQAHIHMHMHRDTCIHMYIYRHAHVHTGEHTHTCTYTGTHSYRERNTHIRIYRYPQYTHIQTHTPVLGMPSQGRAYDMTQPGQQTLDSAPGRPSISPAFVK